ncbi:MAG TPA: hypothetical protein VKB93_21775 [Thermoanaerobaculia bacterium]|nr:hypothetical protein [Thermoanaerobaculia bacterium]
MSPSICKEVFASTHSLNFSDVDTWGLRADAVKVLGNGRHIVTYGVEATRDDSFNTDFSTTTPTIRTPHGNSVTVKDGRHRQRTQRDEHGLRRLRTGRDLHRQTPQRHVGNPL